MHRPHRRPLRLLFRAVLALVVLLAAAWFGTRWTLARSVADYAGEFTIPGLDGPIEIFYDEKGIPQVWAETDGDAVFALGWLHASERLFQMELARRMAAGELAELVGDVAYEVDVRQRRLGFARKARAEAADLDPATRTILERYVDGINTWVGRRRILPPEFVALRFRPREWTIEDVLTVAVYSTWYSHGLMDQDGVYQTLSRDLGPEVLDLLRSFKPWSPPTVTDGILAGLFEADPFPLRAGHGSNAWAVAPARSASGHALHASDPHLEIQSVPGFWYAAGLHSAEGLEAVGITAPGTPHIHMGHNGRIAWAGTVSSVDIVDYYREMLHPEDSLRVRTPDGWVPIEVTWEEIRVKGEDEARRVAVWRTPRGAVVERNDSTATSLHWAGYDFSTASIIPAALDLMRASDFDAFRHAVTRLGGLDHNWVYSDRAGNIGYQLGTPVPVRSYDPYLTQDAADPAVVWSGYRPLDETPHALNPASGWIASTNNQIVPDTWPYELPGFYHLDRATRIATLLETKPVFDRGDMEAFQLDRISGGALRRKEIAAAGAERLGRADIATALRDWDGAMAEEDTVATIYALWWEFLPRHLFEDELGDRWWQARSLLDEVVDGDIAHLIDDVRTPEIEDLAAISARAMEEALELAGGRSFGQASTLRIMHPLGSVRTLAAILRLNRGPIPWGGDPGTLNATNAAYDPETASFKAMYGPSMRFIMDWSDVDAFTLNVWPGQSGNPFSRHYDDFLELGRTGGRWTVPFTRQTVEARAASRVRLVPAPGTPNY